jgi:two-component system, NtrC family, sensor histidine kinase HydH
MSWFGVGADVRGGAARRILGERPAPHEVRVTPRDGFEEIQRQEMSRLFGLFTRARLALIPALVVLFAWTWWVDPTGWRIIILAVAVPLLAAIFVFEYRRWQRRGLSRHAIDRNLVVGILGVVTLSVVSGGLQSPFLPVMVVLTVAIGLFGSPAVATWLMGFEIFAVLNFTVLELTRGDGWLRIPALSGEGRLPTARTLTLAVTFTVLMTLSRHLGRFVRRAFDAMLRRTVRAQTESLRAHAERAEELTALSAEIAHELKNPLASVKGLAGLLAPGVTAGKGSERLAVLRHEVDRMQAILDEFLNFSRPLVPLALGDHDAGDLCREVAALHEGLAHERGVELEVVAEAPAPARCDPRKVKQVLINLVQNALDAAPPESVVQLRASAEPGGGARVVVADRGRGLDPAVGRLVFDPGVTTKAQGSGLGLTIARALARQHGGELSLTSRDGGGTEAVLLLPGGDVPMAGTPGACA